MPLVTDALERRVKASPQDGQAMADLAALLAMKRLSDSKDRRPAQLSARATVESRVAAVAGTGQMVEERMDPTRMRVTQNGHCVEVHVSRNAQIDPFNQSVAPTPKLVKPSC